MRRGSRRDDGQGERSEHRDNGAVLSRQSRQRHQQHGQGDQSEPAARLGPPRGGLGQGRKSGQAGAGEEHVLPDDAGVDQPKRRSHAGHGDDDRGPAPGGALRQREQPGQGAEQQQAVEHDEQTCARGHRIRQAQKPRHDRWMPAVVDFRASLPKLQHRVV